MARTWNMTVASIESKVRIITNDTEASDAKRRNKSPEILAWINDAVQAMVTVLPGLFAVEGTHTCAAGAYQVVDLERSVMLLDVLNIPACDMAELKRFRPAWQSDAAGPAENWMRNGDEHLSFYVYPPAVIYTDLRVLYAKSPDPITDIVPVPEQYEPAIVDYVVAMCESKDDEHVSSSRAAMAMGNFIARLTGKVGATTQG